MHRTVGGHPQRLREVLRHVLSDPGIAVTVLFDPVRRQTVELGGHIVGPRAGRRGVEETEGAISVEVVGVAEVACHEPIALFVAHPLDDEVLLPAVPAERQRVETLGAIPRGILLLGEGDDAFVLGLDGRVRARSPRDELVQLEREQRSTGRRVEDLAAGDERGA